MLAFVGADITQPEPGVPGFQTPDGTEPRTLTQRCGPVVLTAAIVVLVAVAALTIPALRHCADDALHGNLRGLRREIRGLGMDGVVLLFALMLVHAIVPYPSEILTATAGYVLGFPAGLALSSAGWTACAALSYLVGLAVGRPLLHALLRARFRDLDAAMGRGGVALLLIWRLLPVVPFSLLGYVQGATRRSAWTLVWTSFLGYLPLTVAIAYLGSQARSLSASNPLLWAAIVGLALLLIGARIVSRRMHQPPAVASSADPRPSRQTPAGSQSIR